ncbi:MAG: hypothetical protein R3C26_18615 [Calditrichia bacterium]
MNAAISGKLPDGWDEKLLQFKPSDGENGNPESIRCGDQFCLPIAFRGHRRQRRSHTIIKYVHKIQRLFLKETPANRNIAWVCASIKAAAACNGLALHGGIRPYGATFSCSPDYARPGIRFRTAHLPVICDMTHDSIGLGEDGPTQPVEHLASPAGMPNVTLIRPADANETIFAWKAALENANGPTQLVQCLPVRDCLFLIAANSVRLMG